MTSILAEQIQNYGMVKGSASQSEFDLVILGTGATGLACVRYCQRKGLSCVVTDTREKPPNLAQIRSQFPQLPIFTGAEVANIVSRASRVMVSPGVPLDMPVLQSALGDRHTVVGDIELFLADAAAPVIAISGSNGKSTVATLTAQMLNATGLIARSGGNLGPPALDLLSGSRPDYYVLELSSFQLERTPSMRSQVAALLNVSTDHLDHHRSFEDYVAAKQAVFKDAQIAVLNRDDAQVSGLVPEVETVRYFGLAEPQGGLDFGIHQLAGKAYIAKGDKTLMAVADLKIDGRHNVANALAACCIVDAVGAAQQRSYRALRRFTGLPHRCQCVLNTDDVAWYNDSKATNVGATCAAIEGLFSTGRSGVLIAGGRSKGADFARLADVLRGRVHDVILMGEAGPLVQRHVPADIGSHFAANMREAVVKAAGLARRGDAVLLSPACASFDMYDNYTVRGAAFEQAVRELERS